MAYRDFFIKGWDVYLRPVSDNSSNVLDVVADNIKTFYPDSSWIEKITYEPMAEVLRVHKGNDSVYVYYNVPLFVFEDFKSAPSPGEYFNNYIRGQYSFFLL